MALASVVVVLVAVRMSSCLFGYGLCDEACSGVEGKSIVVPTVRGATRRELVVKVLSLALSALSCEGVDKLRAITDCPAMHEVGDDDSTSGEGRSTYLDVRRCAGAFVPRVVACCYLIDITHGVDCINFAIRRWRWGRSAYRGN